MGTLAIFICTFFLIQSTWATFEDDINNRLQEGGNCTSSLSRQRRYLVFPEGSSFQVVFDLTYPSVAIQGNAFMFGHTAAMAWELPSKPLFLDKNKFKKEEKATAAKSTVKTPLEYLWEKSDYVYHEAHNQPPFSWDYSELQEYSQWPNNVNRASRFWTNINSFRKPGEAIKRSLAHHVQRRSRRELYGKIEKLLNALSKDGKSCVLKAICQVKKLSSAKGTFWEEIIKAIFRAKHDTIPDEDHYDRAANVNHDCDRMYPDCDGHVLSNLFRNRIRK